MITWLRYVPHGDLLRHLALGWIIRDELHGTNHGHFAVLMIWRGDGPPPNEKPAGAGPAG